MPYQQLFKLSEAATLIAEATGGDKFDVAKRISNDTRLTNFQFYDTEGRAFQCSQVLYGITSDIPEKGPLKFSDAQCFFHRMDIHQLLNFLGYHPSIQEKILNARPLIASPESATYQAIPEPPQASEAAPVVAGRAKDYEVWKVRARQRAEEIIKRQKVKDLHPNQEAIANEIAREFRQAGIVGAGGKPLTGAYIKRHALKGISSAQNRQLSTSIRWGK